MGDVGVGFIVGIGLLVAFVGDGEEAPRGAVVGPLLGVWAAQGALAAGQLGGFLQEAFIGVVFGAAFGALADRRPWHPAAWVLGGPLVAWLVRACVGAVPELWRGFGPWASGALYTASIAATLGERHAVARTRAVRFLAVGLLAELLGPLAFLPLLATPWLPRQPRWVGVWLLVPLAALAATLLPWFPYRLPAWDASWFPGPPGRGYALTPAAEYLATPLLAGAVACAVLFRPGRRLRSR